MRDKKKVIFNYFIFIVTTILLVAFQCSLWNQYLGSFPAPHFWIPTLAYWTVSRQPREGFVMSFFMALIIAPFTATPLSYLLVILLLLFAFTLMLKMKFYQSGHIYFSLMCGFMSFAFVPLHFLVVLFFEPNDVLLDIHFFHWILKTLLTILASIPMLTLYEYYDRFTEKKLPTEIGRSLG